VQPRHTGFLDGAIAVTPLGRPSRPPLEKHGRSKTMNLLLRNLSSRLFTGVFASSRSYLLSDPREH
jgi:hypothetical protein